MNPLAFPWLVLPGVDPISPFWAQVRGWNSAFGSDWMAAREADPELYAETDIRLIYGGPDTGPPSVIWQPANQSNSLRFKPLIFPVPEPSTLAFAALGGVALLLVRQNKSIAKR